MTPMLGSFLNSCIAVSLASVAGVSQCQQHQLTFVPAVERPVVFDDPRLDLDGRAVPVRIRHADYVPGKTVDQIRLFNEKRSELEFFGDLTGPGQEVRLRKGKAYISSDDMVPAQDWPLRYVLTTQTTYQHRGDDPEVGDFRPYVRGVRIDKRRFDKDGIELKLDSNERTGRRVYALGAGFYYLGTETQPRRLVSTFEWRICRKSTELPNPCRDGRLHSDGTLMTPRGHRVADFSVGHFANIFGSPGNDHIWVNSYWALQQDPVLPLMISDHPMSKDGKVRKGRAMCMADCPSGYLFKLLKTGDTLPLTQ
jgi:hypothetical protein